jgi:hypothetical protein
VTTKTLPDFIATWKRSELSERAAAQSHFIELCDVLGQPRPSHDPTGDSFTFEKRVSKPAGEKGFADVWKRGHFVWEYKGKRKNLAEAYKQILLYRDDLENPPLLVVCDMDRFEIHTNFTGTAPRVYSFSLDDLARPEPTPATHGITPREVLEALFRNPERLRPLYTAEQVTERAARRFSEIAASLRARGEDPRESAHFLMRLLFCLFAEDIGLLPNHVFTRLVQRTRTQPDIFLEMVGLLFRTMATGGWFALEQIPHFNGGLFTDARALDLTKDELEVIHLATALDWSSIEPVIFGTLFERTLDPTTRAQLGAHYTSRTDIELIVEPVLMAPLRRRWKQVQAQANELITQRDAAAARLRERPQEVGRRSARPGVSLQERTAEHQQLTALLRDFSAEIAACRVLDPACGSGNFLYVALKRLLDLENEVISFAAYNGVGAFFPRVGPEQRWPRWWCGSATSNGSGIMASASPRNRSSSPCRPSR